MRQTVQHHAIVEEIESNKVVVSIVQKSACSGCHAAAYCCSADCQERRIEAAHPGYPLSVGEQVLLEGREELGWLAILYSFVLPLVVLVAALALAISVLHWSDLLSAAFALGPTAIYFLGLKLFGKKLKKTFVFTIEKINRPEDI